MDEYTLASEEILVKSIPNRGNKPIFNALWQETEKKIIVPGAKGSGGEHRMR